MTAQISRFPDPRTLQRPFTRLSTHRLDNHLIVAVPSTNGACDFCLVPVATPSAYTGKAVRDCASAIAVLQPQRAPLVITRSEDARAHLFTILSANRYYFSNTEVETAYRDLLITGWLTVLREQSADNLPLSALASLFQWLADELSDSREAVGQRYVLFQKISRLLAPHP